MNNYADIKRIGRGNYGTVSLARDVRNARDYCLKEISMEAFSAAEREQAEQEVQVLRSLNHPGIVRYHEHFVAGETLCVVMAYCEGGDLSREIKRRATAHRPFSEAEVLDWFVQMVMALRYVHSKRILHRDLKTQNIFIAHHQARALIKLGDFGIAKVMEGSMAAASTVIGTPYYMSPEVCQNQPYSYKSDVWALGCILYEMCALQQAWNGSNLLGLVYKIVQQKYPPLPESYSQKLRELVGMMLSKLPEQRPSLEEILAMGFIRDFLQSQVSQYAAAPPRPAHASSSPSPALFPTPGPDSPAPAQRSPPKAGDARARLGSAARLRSAVFDAAGEPGRDSGWDGSGGSAGSGNSAGSVPPGRGSSHGSSREGREADGRRPKSGADGRRRSSLAVCETDDQRRCLPRPGPPTPAARKDRPPSGDRSRPPAAGSCAAHCYGGAPPSTLPPPVLTADGSGVGREGGAYGWMSDRSSQRDSVASLGGEADRGREADLLTPTERMRKKKMEEADRRSHELKQALASCYENRQLANGIRSMHLRSNLDASCNLRPGVTNAGSGVSSPCGCGSPCALHMRAGGSTCSSPHEPPSSSLRYEGGAPPGCFANGSGVPMAGGTLRCADGFCAGSGLRPPPLGGMGSGTSSPLVSPGQGTSRGPPSFSLSTPATPSLLAPPHPPSLLPQPSPSYLAVGSRAGSGTDMRPPIGASQPRSRAGSARNAEAEAAVAGEDDEMYYEDDFEEYDGTTRAELVLRTERAAVQARESNARDADERQRLLQQAHDRYVPSRGSEPPPRAGSASHRPNDDSADVVHPTRPAKSLLTDKCRETLGELFPPVYAYLKKARGEAVPEDKVRKHLSGLVGRERLNDCFCVDQLVFTEEMMN